MNGNGYWAYYKPKVRYCDGLWAQVKYTGSGLTFQSIPAGHCLLIGSPDNTPLLEPPEKGPAYYSINKHAWDTDSMQVFAKSWMQKKKAIYVLGPQRLMKETIKKHS